MLKTHRVGGDDFPGGRNFLEKPEVQPVCRRDKQGVGSFGCGEQLLLAERKLVRISPSFVIAIDAVFNFLRITTGYNQNGVGHTQHLLRRAEGDADAKLLGCVLVVARANSWEGGTTPPPGPRRV